MKKIKNNAAVDVPADREATDQAILKIGVAQRERARIQAAMNDRLAEIKKEFEGQAQPFNAQIETLAKGVQIFCEANRDSLTGKGKKFHVFASGAVNWRKRPPRVSLRGIPAVIDRLKMLGLERFLRVKEEISKEAMLAEPDVAGSVDGVKIGSGGEDFVITPSETKLDEVAS